jgi:hypothetical protein
MLNYQQLPMAADLGVVLGLPVVTVLLATLSMTRMRR